MREATLTSDIFKKRWLVLSYYTGIDGMACSQHIDDRFSLLRQRGIEPLLMTSVCGEIVPGMATFRVPSVGPSGIKAELRHLRRRKQMPEALCRLLTLLTLPFYFLEKAIIDLDSEWNWFPLAIIRGKNICRHYLPELIYSTGGPSSAHLAAAFIARRRGIPWIAELQDPLVHGDWQRSRRALAFFKWLERFICKRADAVIFLTNGARQQADLRTGLGRRGRAVYPGADPAAMPAVSYKKGDYFHVAHFGSLGGSRNLKIFLEGLKLFLGERPELAKIVRLDLYGHCDRLSSKLIKSFPCTEVIRDFGRVPHRQSLSAMKQSDLLLLIQNTEEFSADTIPSKTYEYLLAARPILGLVHKNQELEQILADLGHVAVAATSAAAVKGALADCYEKWAKDKNDASIGLSPYTVSAAVDALLGIAAAIERPCHPGGKHG